MDTQDDPSQTSTEGKVQPSVTREHLGSYWIGLGMALDWIALRGQPIPAELYDGREDDAAEKLVAVLADLPPAIAEATVRGMAEREAGPLVPIPSGIWRQTATSDANDSGQPFRLIGTDEFYEWDGAIHGIHVYGYSRVQIKTTFVLENWPEQTLELVPPSMPRAVARAEVRRLIETIIALAPDEVMPLSQREMVILVKRRIPASTRDQIRAIYRELMPTPKPGPKSGRIPDRERLIKELGEKVIAAQLPN